MIKINQHLKKIDGKCVLPGSFRYCTGRKNNEFFAWWDNGDIIVETTIFDDKLLEKKIRSWRTRERDKVVKSIRQTIELLDLHNLGLETFIDCYNIMSATKPSNED